MKGVEVSFDLASSVVLSGPVGAYLRTATGSFQLEVTQGGLRLLYIADAGGTASVKLADGYYINGGFYPGNLRCVVRAYEDGGIVAQIGDLTLNWGMINVPGGLTAFPKIIAAGVYVDPRYDVTSVRFDNLKIGPIPAIGGTRFRSLPAEPPAIAPKFTKRGVIFTLAQADTGHGMLNFSPINMGALAAKLGITPIDNFYAWFSTDHGAGDTVDGGIFLATAPTMLGPWTRRGAAGYAGRIFTDGAGRQCETPVVNYDPDTNRLLMLYQVYKAGGVNIQETCVASSVDGLNWTSLGPIYSWSGTALAADYGRHTGYMGTFRDPLGIVPGWTGHGRLSPGVQGKTCVSRSLDGVHFEIDMVPTEFPFLQGESGTPNLIHNHGSATAVFAYQGQRLIVVAPFRAVSQGENKGYLALVRLGDDMRNMSAQEVIPFPLDDPEELSGAPIISGALVDNNIFYLIYQSNGKSMRLATADLTKGPDGLARPFGG